MTCLNCGGLIMEPNKTYGWAGPVCYCPKQSTRIYQRPANPATQPQSGPSCGRPVDRSGLHGLTLEIAEEVLAKKEAQIASLTAENERLIVAQEEKLEEERGCGTGQPPAPETAPVTLTARKDNQAGTIPKAPESDALIGDMENQIWIWSERAFKTEARLAQAEEREKALCREYEECLSDLNEYVDKRVELDKQIAAAQAREQRLIAALEELVKELQMAHRRYATSEYYDSYVAYGKAAEWAQAALDKGRGDE